MLAKNAGLSDKLVSVNHHIASENKLTAGEAAKIISKAVNKKIAAKQMVKIFKMLLGKEPEWHHSGFFNRPGKGPGKKTMGRTYFFTHEEVTQIIGEWEEVENHIKILEEDGILKAKTPVIGFFFRWEKGERKYKGGPRRKIKVLDTFDGMESDAPRNFTSCSPEQFEKAKSLKGKIYTGYDEPKLQDFS